MAGIRTPDLQEKSTLDDFIGNKDSGAGSETVRVSAAAAAAQLRTLIQFDSAVVLVKTKTLSAPPGGEAIGDRYIVKPTGSGAFAGKDNNVATKTADGWSFVAPGNGYRAFLLDEKVDYYWDATAAKWTVITSGSIGVLTYADIVAITAAPANATATAYNDTKTATISRARASNVATVVLSGLLTPALAVGMHVNVASLGGAGYNGTVALASVTTGGGNTTITYPSTGSNESTTADTGGTLDRTGVYKSDGAGGWSWLNNIDLVVLDARVTALEDDLVSIPAAMADVNSAMRSTGAASSDFSDTTYGDATPDTSTNVTVLFAYGNAIPSLKDGYLKSATVRTSASGIGRFFIVDKLGKVLQDIQKSIPAAGANTITFADGLFVPAGARIYYQAVSAAYLRYDSGGSSLYFAMTGYPGVGGTVSQVANASKFAISFVVSSVAHTHAASIADAATEIAGLPDTLGKARSSKIWTVTYSDGAPSIGMVMVGHDVGQDIPKNSIVTAVVADLSAKTGTSYFCVRIYVRDSSSGSIDNLPVFGTDTLVSLAYLTMADLGLTAGAAIASVAFPISPFKALAGKTYFAEILAFDALGNAINFNKIGYTTNSIDARQRRRGWLGLSSYSGLAIYNEFTVGFYSIAQKDAGAVSSTFERITDATIATSGLAVTATVVATRDGGGNIAATYSGTLTAPSGANIRYDALYYDAVAGLYYDAVQATVGVIAGTERATDQGEFIPALGNSNYIRVANLRVTATSIDVVQTWKLDENGDHCDLAAALESERRRGRRSLPKLRAKIAKGSAIKIVSVGDSIVAIQSAAPGFGTPNGTMRDAAAASLASAFHYLRDNIGADVVDALPLYTSVQLGRADDGGGAIHTKVGFVWELVAALQKLSLTVTYDNFGVGGVASDSALTSGVPNAWITNAIALAPDVVILNFGMNERGFTTTEANLVTIGNAFIAAGIDVIMMGCVRAHGLSGVTFEAWRYTERAIARAAKYIGAAYVSTLPIYNDGFTGAIGFSNADTCMANINNHPGLAEHRAIGRELVKLVIG